MDQVIPGLWIGDLACALATDYLSIAGITHIVTAMKQRLPSPITLPDGRVIDAEHMYHINLDDVDNAPILVHFPGAVEFIQTALQQEWIEDDEEAQKQQDNDEDPPTGRGPGQWATMGEGTVLVHCHAGISRSVAIVVAYLMHVRQWSRDDALRLVRSRRAQADPNAGFMHQLELYESGRCNVDVRNQRIRRFLMSQSSILRGDPIDDVMLSYYPSPFHSPAASSSGGASAAGPGSGLQFSTLDDGSGGDDAVPSSLAATSTSRRNSTHSGGSISPISSIAMSRQNSRKAISTAVAKGAQERHRRTRSRSEGGASVQQNGTVRAFTTNATTSEQEQLSKSPPMPVHLSTKELFDADDDVNVSTMQRDENVQALIRQSFSSTVREPHEVMITVSSRNLPGGVRSVRGNQTDTAKDQSAQQQQQQQHGVRRLPKPHFAGRKLRCRMCRRELAAQDHVVEHEAGKGKDAFDVRKREKDVEQKSRDGRAALGTVSSGRRSMSTEEMFGAQRRASDDHAFDETKEHKTVSDTVPPTASSASTSTYKSAASLSAQLPPHLAALRLGRNTSTATATPTSDTATSTKMTTKAATAANGSYADVRKMLHSPLCSSYFVEPLAWMSAVQHGEIAGRLDCPNARCGAKLGSWDWAGMQCACGAWVTPAFALHRSKVDEV